MIPEIVSVVLIIWIFVGFIGNVVAWERVKGRDMDIGNWRRL